MFNKFLKITLITLVVVFIASVATSNPVLAQDSYLDSIYQAVNGEAGTSELSANAPEEGVVINTDDPNATVTVGSEPVTSTDTESASNTSTDTGSDTENNEELQHINVVLADMTRILIGMNMGVPIDTSKFTLIDLLGTSTSTSTSTETEENTNTSTSTSTSISTSTDTQTETSTNTSTDTVPNTDTGTATATDNPGLNTDTGSNTSTSTSTSTSTDTGSDTSTDTGTNTNTATDANTDPEAISEIKSMIKSKYGISCTDGTAKFTVTQLEIMATILEQLPTEFRSCTTEFIRDSKNEEIDENTGGYVILPESKVHILDRAVIYTSQIIEENEELNGPCSDEKLYSLLEFGYRQAIVHEMTHCFQNKGYDEENKKYNSVTQAWENTFWPGGNIKGQSVSSYGNTKYIEDMAECVAFYVLGGAIVKDKDGTEYFKTSSPYTNSSKMDLERYNFIKNNIMGGKEFITEHYGSTTISL